MPLLRRPIVLALACAALVLGGCGSDNEEEASSTPAPAATPEATPEPTKPEVTVPKGKAPKKLQIKDLEPGSGPAAQPGQNVQVQYVGVSYANGRQFDASWDRGEPFTFQLGAGQVIPGWDQGVAGMKVGGRRQLVIPPDLAYGEQGSPPAIGPDETLVFVVDLVAIQ
jgi:peptidylprolyl isomerase